ncbi:MAG: phosphate propanoyltransferase [Calditrichaeota bacterium]|nr:MAG: phosphate propanoyltransferase [Calditrichota bacterium]
MVRQVVQSALADETKLYVPIEVSARHVHISKNDLEILFGPGSKLTKYKDLKQPGEFAANETVTVVGPKNRIVENIRILGPIRQKTQVELSYSDGIHLGIDLPHRLSGDLQKSAPVNLIGPRGILQLREGAIRAMRHIHMSTELARQWNLFQGQKVKVRTHGPMQVTFNNSVIRIGEGLKLAMHIDTDEANAAGIQSGEFGEIIVE